MLLNSIMLHVNGIIIYYCICLLYILCSLYNFSDDLIMTVMGAHKEIFRGTHTQFFFNFSQQIMALMIGILYCFDSVFKFQGGTCPPIAPSYGCPW